MSTETSVLAACLASRTTYELAVRFLDSKSASREMQILMAAIGDYYRKDSAATRVDANILSGVVQASVSNPKHRKVFDDLIQAAATQDVSTANVNELILATKKREIATKLAVSLANNDNKAVGLLEEYNVLAKLSSIEELEQEDEVEIIDSSLIKTLITDMVNNEGAFQLYPRALNDRLGGRLNRGHHITLFAPPEVGKTALNCTFAAGFCRQGRKGLLFVNEDKKEDYYFRIVSCLTGLSFDEIRANPDKATEAAIAHGIDNLRLVSMAPGNMYIVEKYVDKLAPEWYGIDQMINMHVPKADGLPQILGKVSSGARRIGKQYNTLTITTCQGGDSAEGKAVLEMGDVYMSNCLAKGELVRMFDGAIKAIEDIKVGEQVMGMDNSPRNVLATGRGVAPLYKITHKNRDSYTVNEDHIMVVKNADTVNRAGIKPKQIADIELKTLLGRKHLLAKLKGVYKGRITYPAKELPLDPYLFGLWLADGFSHTFAISTSDTQLKEHLNQRYDNASNRVVNSSSWVVGFDQGGWKNPNNIKLKELGVYKNKHIPQVYLTSSVSQRLELLSGIIDGDGYLFKPGESKGDNYRVALGHNEALALGVKELATGLGFASTIRHQAGNGYTVYIAGPVTDLSCVLTRKIATENSKIDCLASVLTIDKVTDSGEFYGICVDGDRRYVLANNIVTHNTEVPGACDVLIGIGANKEMLTRNERTVSFCKNKVTGDHSPVHLSLIPAISRYVSGGA